nr:fimbrial protein [Serratia quinivorans]
MSMKNCIIKNHKYQCRRYAVSLILLGSSVVGSEASAGCWFSNGYVASIATLSLPTTLTIQRDTPAGTVLWDSGMVFAGSPTRVQCDATNKNYYSYYPGITDSVPGMSGVYKTALNSIGIRTYGSNSRNNISGELIEIPGAQGSFGSGTYVPIAGYRIQLIATGTNSGIGVLTLPTPLVALSYNGLLSTQLNLSNASVSVASSACSLTSTSINVPLGDVAATKFTGIATTAGDKSFDLGLTCDKDAKINVSLAGTQNTDTTETSVLALTSAGQSGTASGVGVQLLYGGTPLKINNNILLKSSAGGQETLPFTARYYQTLADISAGLANSSATLNITYQ